jgi:CRISPR-associated protein Csm5
MKNNKPSYFKIKLEVLTPIHIGCDENLSPIEFIIDSSSNTLIKFSLFELLENLSPTEREELGKIANKRAVTALVDLYRFYAYRIKEKIKKLTKNKIFKIPGELAKRYEEVLKYTREQDIIQNFNSFEIPRTFFNPYTEEPIIPGSSLKGALRTGFLEYLLGKKANIPKVKKFVTDIQNINVFTKRGEISKLSRELEQELLFYKKISEDPFNLLKISDLTPVHPVSTEILFQINVSKEKGETRGNLSLPLEVIPSRSIFQGELHIEGKRESIREPLDFFKIINATHHHYLSILKNESALFKNLGFNVPPFLPSHSQAIKEKQAILIKLGKHSGAEAMTINGIRKILIKKAGGRKEYKESPTTFWLASQSKNNLTQALSFGWAILYFESLL